jgi:hypothetical protein
MISIIRFLKKQNEYRCYNIKINEKYNILYIFVKYCASIIIFFNLFFYKHIFIKKIKIKLDIDNIFEIPLYENDIIFSNYSTEIKPIALYYPDFIGFNQYFISNIVKNENESLDEIILKQVDLARNHGIYGFAINYVFSYNENIYDNVLNIFLNNNKMYFPFLLNWKNDNFKVFNHINLELINFIKTIKKYLISKNYIKINNKPLISIENPFIFQNLNEILLLLRRKAKENEIGEIFIIFPLNESINEKRYLEYFDGAFDFSKSEPLEKYKNKQKISYYSGIIYKNLILNNINNLKDKKLIYRTSTLEIPYKSLKNNLKGYTIEKFYILNNIIIDWTKNNLSKTKGFFFINSWNNYLGGNYLEPDKLNGYASINTFSKALFNIPFYRKNYHFNFNNKCIIAVQAHIYYEDLIDEVINKTNNIPVKFDLYLSVVSKRQENIIDDRIKKKSNANKYEIQLVKNKGRDILPIITQMKFKIKRYKYFCHIHTKKTKHDTNLGSNWRSYLFENLLGNKEIISDILMEFEKYDKLGLIFPEVYYDIIKDIDNYDSTEFPLHKPNIKYMNFVLEKLFPGFCIGNKMIFPTGDMFWSKISAIHQIFNIRFKKKFPKELNQTNETLMHGIERIWLYIVKLNGYYFKIIFNHF